MKRVYSGVLKCLAIKCSVLLECLLIPKLEYTYTFTSFDNILRI